MHPFYYFVSLQKHKAQTKKCLQYLHALMHNSNCIKILELSLIYTTQDFCSGSMFTLTLTTYAGVSFKAGFIHWAQGKLVASLAFVRVQRRKQLAKK